MKKVRNFLFSTHRVLGVIVCLFFFMWFISGLVLIYHPFPNISKSQKYDKQEALPSSLPNLQSILNRIPSATEKIQNIKLRCFQGEVIYTIKTKDSTYLLNADSEREIKPVTFETIRLIAKQWVDAPVLKIDTLNKRDQWIMYSRYEEELPIYKFYFADNQKHQLYIASKTGEVQQLTNTSQRFWAWMGAIPHKFYLPFIRANADTWIKTVTVAGIIAFIASLTGVYYGIYVLYKRYRNRKKLDNPYRKCWYKWHYILGLVFGVFLITWAFSGAISMQKIPQWVIKLKNEYSVSPSKIRGKQLPLSSYALDYRLIKESYPNVKEIEWSNFQDIPIYNIIAGDQSICIDASTDNVKTLNIPQQQIEKSIGGIYGDSISFKIGLINNYDEYYLSLKEKLPLPVYRVDVDNFNKNRFYIDPATGDFKNLDKRRRVKRWIFNAPHYLQFKYLYEHPAIWRTVMWILCIGGALASLTGVYLSSRYILRKVFKKKKF